MIWFYVLTILIISIDQLSKWIVVKQMAFGEQIPVIENFFYITSHRNSGAAWGILEGKMGLFYLITAVVVIGLIYYLHKYGKHAVWMAIPLSIILGGAIGNFIDRIVRQEVVDFLDFIIFTYDFPVFNLADSSLVVGVGLLLVATIIDEKKKGGPPKSS